MVDCEGTALEVPVDVYAADTWRLLCFFGSACTFTCARLIRSEAGKLERENKARDDIFQLTGSCMGLVGRHAQLTFRQTSFIEVVTVSKSLLFMSTCFYALHKEPLRQEDREKNSDRGSVHFEHLLTGRVVLDGAKY